MSETNHPLYKKLIEIDNGRFCKILSTFRITNECFKCRTFNQKAESAYLCAVTPYCIGDTLSEHVKSYLLWKLDIITEDEHHKNLKIGKYEEKE